MLNDPIVIVGAARTPMGGFQGDFASLAASDLGAVAIKAAVERAGIEARRRRRSDHGQRAARRAGPGAGAPGGAQGGAADRRRLHDGQQDVRLGDEGGDARARRCIAAGSADIVVAGGMESMTNAPYLLPKARGGYRMGHQVVQDHMFLDGLEDAYDKGRLMGTFAEECATTFAFTREAQDAFALTSLSRALAANNDGTFAWEIAPVTVSGKKGDVVIDKDEQPAKASPDKIPLLKPAFRKDGTVTAANSSSISDGAAALVLMRALDGGEARVEAAGGDRRPRDARAGARAVHDRAGRRDREAVREGRLDHAATSTSSRSTRRSPSSRWRR